MLQIKLNNSTVLPMRPDAPEKTFGSADVPHGTQSVFYKAIKVYNSNNPASRIGLPTFTEEELEQHKATFEATVEVLPLLDEEENPIDYSMTLLAANQVMEPTEAEVEADYYDIDEEGNKTVKMVKSDDPMEMTETQKYADLAACKAAIIADRKSICAQAILDNAINECLIVPELSEEFMAQFESFEAEEM